MQRPDVKHLRAVVVLAEERHFSRAAARLRIGQSGLTKQISAVEMFLGFALFVREPRKVTVTSAGEVFVSEARLALQHYERAINLSKASSDRARLTIHVGKTPYTDPYLITKLLSLRLPLFPELQIELSSRFSSELKDELLDGTLDLAFLTGNLDTSRLSGSLVADQSFWVAMLEEDDLAQMPEVVPEDLRSHSCILFEKHVQPDLYDRFVRLVQPASKQGCSLHHVQMVLRRCGIAILTQTGAWRISRSGVTIRPLKLNDLRLQTRLVARADNGSKVLSDVVRSFAKALDSRSNGQFQLPLLN